MKNKISVKPNSSLQNKTGSWRTFRPLIDWNKCIGCTTCTKVCPEGTIDMVEVGGQKKAKVNYDYCKGCGLCAKECPVRAIIMEKEDK